MHWGECAAWAFGVAPSRAPRAWELTARAGRQPLRRQKTSWALLTCAVRIGRLAVRSEKDLVMFTRALTRRFPVLSNRNFRLLLADRLLAPMAFSFSLVGVSFAVLSVTTTAAHPSGSTSDLSYVLAAQIAPSLVFLLIGGVIADRIAPQFVIVAANLMIAVGEGTFGVLVLTGRPNLWTMIGLEFLTGTGMALFYPASTALLPRLVPASQLQEASAVSRLAMNAAMMGGAALAGECVALVGAGWALAACGVGMLGTVPLMLAIRLAPAGARTAATQAAAEAATQESPSMLRELREGWSEFWSHTWLWATVFQFTVVLAAWCGGFQVLGRRWPKRTSAEPRRGGSSPLPRRPG